MMEVCGPGDPDVLAVQGHSRRRHLWEPDDESPHPYDPAAPAHRVGSIDDARHRAATGSVVTAAPTTGTTGGDAA